MQPSDVLFPHDAFRPVQDRFIDAVFTAVKEGKNLVVHAPTGLGKTAASLAPALTAALEKDRVVVFLTARHTQHTLAITTLQHIHDRHQKPFLGVDIIGKKWLCLQPNVKRLKSGEFNDYCVRLREDGLCEYYTNARPKETPSKMALSVVTQLKERSPCTVDAIGDAAGQGKVCPYEIAMLLAKDARVIVTDYYYLFHPRIRDGFLRRLSRSLSEMVLIVDEAHNLPHRVREIMNERLSSWMVSRAIAEAKKHGFPDLISDLNALGRILQEYGERCEDEMLVGREDLLQKVGRIAPYDDLVAALAAAGEEVREAQQHSSLAAIADFLESWKRDEEGFVRIYEKKGEAIKHHCLDPSVLTRPVFDQAYATVLMSGTLTPTAMYRELLGVERCCELTLPSPFPKDNRLNLIIPLTSTKYESRSQQEYKNIAQHLSGILDHIPGNVAVYFPSYRLRDDIAHSVITKKTAFSEEQDMDKSEKEGFLERFKSYKMTGAVLFAVINGNFSEGIDLPGDELQGVVIVGLPLTRPDLETKATIDYYEKKFGKGWDYGYVFPAFTKAFQSAGRCIRSSTDRGAIIFLDVRYAWKNYYRCFPEDWQVRVSKEYTTVLDGFFKR
jgi:DNA excision repair protein ERCC-2